MILLQSLLVCALSSRRGNKWPPIPIFHDVNHIWEQVIVALSITIIWHGINLLDASELWWVVSLNAKVHCLPLLICWTIWLTRNGIIFRDKIVRWQSSIAKNFAAYHEIPEENHTLVGHMVSLESIDHNIPQAFFDGAPQAQGCRGHIPLHKTKNHHYKIEMGLGVGTNNYVELISLRHLLHFSLTHACNHIHIFGDSQIIINWFNNIFACHMHSLRNILDEIMILKAQFTISLVNIFTMNVIWLLTNFARPRHI